MTEPDRTDRISVALRVLSSVSIFALAICAIVYVLREPRGPVYVPPGPDRTLVGILAQLTALQEKLLKSASIASADEKALPAGLQQPIPDREAPTATNVTVVIESAKKPEQKCCSDGKFAETDLNERKSAEAILNVYTAVWYPTPDSWDDRGEVDKTIVPRLREYIGSQAERCKIYVDGNTDSVGSDRHNSALSTRRAEAVSQKLSAQFPKSEVRTSASSERNHMRITGDNADQLYNRRTDIHLTCG